MVEVIGTDEFRDWYWSLGQKDTDAVYRSVSLLESDGFALGHPYSSAIKGSNYALRELRVQAGGHPLRVFYIFDTERQAVLLIGGDKTGDSRFYERMIPIAERIWENYKAGG